VLRLLAALAEIRLAEVKLAEVKLVMLRPLSSASLPEITAGRFLVA
jgi:hypothetical protein